MTNSNRKKSTKEQCDHKWHPRTTVGDIQLYQTESTRHYTKLT